MAKKFYDGYDCLDREEFINSYRIQKSRYESAEKEASVSSDHYGSLSSSQEWAIRTSGEAWENMRELSSAFDKRYGESLEDLV